ncbi:hypothetical protein K7472_03150 [Streptomyces sp. PTM05]|uniref:Secreted protein n=1 Tax=Streptantibioticus parmotrematis TaxID=2873249 RepID=A0ABS7QKY3_9ACTN|nr:hypothetical protein [Streptantibioticus parmotrematis]MBY8883838.1 hypothetical protein [Streptantibioticus parmotrematis]
MPIRSGTIVTALTTAALAAIGVLAWQASAAPDHTGGTHAGAAPTPSASVPGKRQGGSPSASARADALPTESGQGKRVVYALGRKRVWLVDVSGTADRTFTVVPGSVSPTPGTYTVTSRTSTPIIGSDGVPVEHVVRFTRVDGTTIGFSEAVNGSLPTPQTGKKAGGVRELPADGDAMWQFALNGTKVIVVP